VKNIYRLFVASLMMLVLSGVATSVAFAQNPDNGKAVWEEQVWQCSRCHGAMGEGMFGRPLSNSTLTAEEWIAQVRTPRRFMPAFSEAQVTDEQITDMHAYITALPDPTGDFVRAEADIPADAPEGQMLLAQKNCVACHGATGPINGFIERGETPTAEVVIAQLRTPRNLMPMFSADQVSDAEATLIADFMAQEVAAQAPPAALPQSGQDVTAVPLALVVAGSALLLFGAALLARKRLARL
jgi:mono/diheme cytochrome c family protein